jgi:beta-lactam-binding protein with PASTA domain
MGRKMAARLTALLPRLLALTVIWLLGAATFTLAAEKKPPPPKVPQTSAHARPPVLTVPDARGKAYVFAKGILQDGGFGWRVQGSVQGYAANVVTSQAPAPGSRVIDNGAPTVTLRLVKNAAYGERGLPENEAPYAGTRIVFLSDWREQHAQSTEPTSTAATTTATTTSTATTTEKKEPTKAAKTRKPDFEVAGAPAEPTDEIPLPDRARRLAREVAAASRPTRTLVDFWLYQHSWIVTGARFGWQDGAEALRILIKVDESLQRRWDFGARSERVARSALAYVEAKTG